MYSGVGDREERLRSEGVERERIVKGFVVCDNAFHSQRDARAI